LAVAVFATGWAFWHPEAAEASIVVAMDLPALVQQADHIAVVDVVSTSADWDAKHERIFSTIELKVVERWKGTAASGGEDRLRIVQPGGSVGDLTMTVTGLSTFTVGERALVFLRGTASHARLLGMSQGKRPMRFVATSGKWMVGAPNLHQATLLKPRDPATTNGKLTTSLPAAATPTTTTTAAATARERELEAFRTEVKALVGTAGRP
jgi:hypothetical protein